MFKLLQFNIAFAADPNWDGINNFRHRLGVILSNVYEKKPDVLCLQEVRPYQYELLRPALRGAGYTMIFNRRVLDKGGEGLAIAVRDETVEFQTLDRYWMSDTPEIPGTRFPNQTEFTRIGQDALLQYLPTGEFIRVMNNHFECRNPEACTKSMRLTLARLALEQSILPTRFFIVGDLNSRPDSEAIRLANEFPGFDVVDVTTELDYTCFSFKDPVNVRGKVDYIFTDRTTAAVHAYTKKWVDSVNRIHLSDHFPVEAAFDF